MAALSGCVHGQPSNFAPKLWAGKSTRVAIVRKQDKKVISCTDPEFDEFVAMTYSDWECVVKHYRAKGTMIQPDCAVMVDEVIFK